MSAVRNILIGGGTGNVGKRLGRTLINKGHNVSIVSRNAKLLNWGTQTLGEKSDKLPTRIISWKDIEKDGLPLETDVVINLAGHTIGNPGPFASYLKKEIYNSRINSTTTLARAIEKAEQPPKVFISASAVGVYENDDTVTHTERGPCVRGRPTYFTDLCRDWEASSRLAEKCETRVVNPRLGVVLATDTEPMRKLLPLGLLANFTLGDGTQPFPWIHMDDVVSIFDRMIEDEGLVGPVNLVAPQIVTNDTFMRAISRACHAGTPMMSMSSFIVRLMYGTERADNILLDSPKVAPEKLQDIGYEFLYQDIDSAMQALVDAKCNDPVFKGKEGRNIFKVTLEKNKSKFG